jgi:hypothetical protein
MLFDYVLLPVSASDCLSISLNVSLGFFLFSPTLYILLSLSSLTLFCFVLLCVAVHSYLASSLDLLFTVNLCLVSIKYKNPKNICLLFTIGNIITFENILFPMLTADWLHLYCTSPQNIIILDRIL